MFAAGNLKLNSIYFGALLALLLGFAPTTSHATEVFGYFEFDYNQKLKDGQTGDKSKSGDFDTAFVSVMLQHEIDIYKFFTEVEFQHGAEFKNSSTGVTATKDAQIVVERAYTEMNFHPMFKVTVGKSMTPNLWKASHYPTIVKPISEPMIITNEVLSGNYVGPMISGELPMGFSYNVWTNRSGNNDSTKDGNNAFSRYARVGYKTKVSAVAMEASYILGTTETITTVSGGTTALQEKPSSFDLNLSYENFLLWLEKSNSDGSNGKSGMYGVLSYSIDTKGGAELSPFILYDQYKESSSKSAFTNYGLGLDYKPTPQIVHKIEYYKQASDSNQSTDGFANGDESLKYQFVYFFN